MSDPLDDPAFDLALGAERVDHAPDVVHGRDALDPYLARLDVHGDLGDLDAEREHLHSRRIRPTRALAEDLGALEQTDDLLERRVEVPVGRDDVAALDVEHALLEVVALRGDLED